MVDLNIGEKIAKLRRDHHLTQEQLAERVNVSSKTVSNIENDNRVIRIDTLLQICRELGTTPNDLFGYKTEESHKLEQIKSLAMQIEVLTKGM